MAGKLTQVISGAQTGADRAALDACLERAFPIGGSCPKGRVAEDGVIDAVYTLTEVGGGFRERTKHNVLDADGTAIFYTSYVSGGTQTALHFCIKHNKPYKLIDISLLDPARAADLLVDFISDFNISVLNVAGPSAGSCPLMYDFVKRAVGDAIEHSVSATCQSAMIPAQP